MSHRFPTTWNSPSTPNRKKLFQSNPSTTPAGPPPSHLTQASTTPSGPPPRSSYFNSSNAASNTFGRRGPTPARRGFAVPSSSPPLREDDEDDGDEDAEGEEDDVMDTTEQSQQHVQSPSKSVFMSSIASGPRGLKRSRNGQVREQVGEDYANIARGVTGHAPSAEVSEADDLLLQQEAILSRMETGKELESAQEGATQLSRLWAQHADAATKEGKLGPEADHDFTKGNYLSSLLLQLHHPHRLRSAQRTQHLLKRGSPNSSTIPRALLDWLETYHNPFPDDFNAIRAYQPSAAANDRFWDTIYSCLVRGRFQQAIILLRDAGWDCAYTAEEDSQPDGYSDRQVENIEEVAERAARLLESCPALRYDDWDVKGADWTVFRQRVRQAIKDLERFAGEEDEEDASPMKPGGNVFSMSAATKKAESKVPWSVYTNLKLSYDILLGSADEIMDASQDWLEASIYITAWWSGEDETDIGAAAASKGSLRKSMAASQKTREVDVTPTSAYRRRLGEAFAYVTDADDSLFVPETMDPLQVGLGCVLSGEVESTIRLLRAWSLPIASAVVEVAALAGWLPQARPRSRGLMQQGFSSEDLMVLSHGPGAQRPQPGELVRDDILGEYADALADREVLRSTDGKTEREGWELAVAVLGRMDDEAEGERKIAELLGRIDVTDAARVDKVLSACLALELGEQARGIAERYADHLACSENAAQNYGPALVYYARAHATPKLKSTLALLTSLCLIHSTAYPAPMEMDLQLEGLLSGRRETLVSLARVDADAATLLAQHLSGYATLRRFYALRDEDLQSGRIGALARARDAANALMAVLESAADCVRGGLYDPEVESVIPVDGVLVLLGEALPLLGQSKRIFTKEQVFGLLRVVEDLASAPGRIRENAGSLLQASITAYRDGSASRSQLLKKSRGDLSRSGSGLGGSSYDMLASSIMVSSEENTDGVDAVVRGWDWRKGLDKMGGSEIGQKEVEMLVRLALAQEVAKGWSEALNW